MFIGGLTLIHSCVVGLQVNEADFSRGDDIAGKWIFYRRLKNIGFIRKEVMKYLHGMD